MDQRTIGRRAQADLSLGRRRSKRNGSACREGKPNVMFLIQRRPCASISDPSTIA